MKFRKNHIQENKIEEIDEVITFKEVRNPVLKAENIKVHASISVSENIYNVHFKIKGTVIVPCSYTAKPTPYEVNFTDSVDISDDIKNLETCYVKGDLVDLNPIILDLIIGEIPSRVISKGAKLNYEIGGVRIMSEAEYKKQKQREIDEYNSMIDKLDK